MFGELTFNNSSNPIQNKAADISNKINTVTPEVKQEAKTNTETKIPALKDFNPTNNLAEPLAGKDVGNNLNIGGASYYKNSDIKIGQKEAGKSGAATTASLNSSNSPKMAYSDGGVINSATGVSARSAAPSGSGGGGSISAA